MWRNAYARKYGCFYRDLALQRILRIHTASKMVVDHPQLTLAAIYLVHSSTGGEPSVSKGVRFEEISFTPHAMHVDV